MSFCCTAAYLNDVTGTTYYSSAAHEYTINGKIVGQIYTHIPGTSDCMFGYERSISGAVNTPSTTKRADFSTRRGGKRAHSQARRGGRELTVRPGHASTYILRIQPRKRTLLVS